MDEDGGDMLSVITRFPVSFEDWYFLIGCQLGLSDCFLLRFQGIFTTLRALNEDGIFV